MENRLINHQITYLQNACILLQTQNSQTALFEMEHFSVCFRQCCWNRKPCTTLKRKIKHREIKSRTVQQQNLHHEDQGQTGKKNKKRNQTFWVCRWKSALLWAPLLAASFCCKETDFPKYIQMCANTHDVFLIPPGTRSWFIPNFDLPVFPDNL